MQVRGATEVVEVSGTAPLVNTQDASMGHAFNTEQVLSLPFEGRDPAGILSLQPGVAYTGNSQSLDSTIDSRSGSVAGGRSDQANITIDGVDDNDPISGNAFQGVFRATLDSLQEFRVTTAAAWPMRGALPARRLCSSPRAAATSSRLSVRLRASHVHYC